MKKISIGIDIGGINSAIGIVNEAGEITAETVVSTSAYPYFEDYPNYVEHLIDAIKRLLLDVKGEYQLCGIGIGAPNASTPNGSIEQPANLWKFRDGENGDESLRSFPLVDDIRKHFDCEVKIANDADAATMGEMHFGAARGMSDFIVITLGTGLGSGIVANGHMILGSELGHISAVHNGRECGCGLRGCLECYASATALRRTAFELMADLRIDSPLRDIPYRKIEALDVAKAAAAGDALSIEAFRYTGEILGRALANFVSTTLPEAIILFGGLAKAGDLLLTPTKKYMDENTLPNYKGKTKLLLSTVKGNVGIIGAAALVF